MTDDRESVVIADAPDARPSAALRLPAVRTRRPRNGLTVITVPTCPAGRSSAPRSCCATARPTSRRRGAAPRSSPPGRCPRAPSATTRSPSSRRPSGSAPRSTPRRAGTRRPPGVEVPASRLEPALELLAEIVAHPTFPESEVERLRDERLNDLLQARADPRRRAEEAFAETIYTRTTRRTTGRRRGPGRPSRRWTAARSARPGERGLDPARTTLIVGRRPRPASTSGRPGRAAVRRLGPSEARGRAGPDLARPTAVDTRLVRLVHRPGSVQTEIRIGHVGVPRRIPDFHAAVGHRRDPRRAVQLAAEHEAARGEGLHVRRRAPGSTCAGRPGRSRRAPRSTPRSPSPAIQRHARRARPDPRRSRSPTPSCGPRATSSSASSRSGSRRPDRSSGARRARRPRAARRRAGALPRADRGGQRGRRPAPPPSAHLHLERAGDRPRRRRRHDRGRASRSAGFGPVEVIRDDDESAEA